jgi:hypothetical protein
MHPRSNRSSRSKVQALISLLPRVETVSECHSEALAEESVLCNVLNP